MKTFLLITSLIVSAVLFAQEGSYTIKGSVGTLDAPAVAYLTYKKEGRHLYDSAFIRQGKFELKGVTEDPFYAVVVIDHHGKGVMNLDRKGKLDVLKLYVEKGTVSLQSKDSVCHSVIGGSVLNKDYHELLGMLKPVEDSLYSVGSNVTPEMVKAPGFKDSLEQLRNKLQLRRRKLAEYYLRANPGRYASLIALLEYLPGAYPDPDKLEPLFQLLTDDIRQTNAGKEFQLMLNTIRLVKVGTQAPEIMEKDVTGRLVKLSDYRGKYVFVDFWASWCGPCRAESPNLVKLHNRFKDKGLVILGVSLDKPDGRADWLKAIKDDRLSWTQVSDLKGWASNAARLYGVRSIPENFLVDPEGKIIATRLSGDELLLYVEKLYAVKPNTNQ